MTANRKVHLSCRFVYYYEESNSNFKMYNLLI